MMLRPTDRQRPSIATRLALAVAATAVVVSLPSVAQAEALTLRFAGTADLSAFGATATTPFRGTVTWDQTGGWVPVWPGCPDFCLDGSDGAVEATIVLDEVDHSHRIEPHSRLMVLGTGALVLDLFLAPAVDFDADTAPGVAYVGLNLWSEPPDYDVLEDGQLPSDLSFLGQLDDRFVLFSDDGWWGQTTAVARPVSVVPEPASIALCAIGVLGALGAGCHGRSGR
jgi:hypothetical protein